MNDLRKRVARAIEARVLRDGFATHEELADAAIAAGVGEVLAWRPIKTAPRDGSEILVYNPARSGPDSVGGQWTTPHHMVVVYWAGDWQLVECGSYASDSEASGTYSHWMPLPTPPAAAEEG